MPGGEPSTASEADSGSRLDRPLAREAPVGHKIEILCVMELAGRRAAALRKLSPGRIMVELWQSVCCGTPPGNVRSPTLTSEPQVRRSAAWKKNSGPRAIERPAIARTDGMRKDSTACSAGKFFLLQSRRPVRQGVSSLAFVNLASTASRVSNAYMRKASSRSRRAHLAGRRARWSG